MRSSVVSQGRLCSQTECNLDPGSAIGDCLLQVDAANCGLMNARSAAICQVALITRFVEIRERERCKFLTLRGANDRRVSLNPLNN